MGHISKSKGSPVYRVAQCQFVHTGCILVFLKKPLKILVEIPNFKVHPIVIHDSSFLLALESFDFFKGTEFDNFYWRLLGYYRCEYPFR